MLTTLACAGLLTWLPQHRAAPPLPRTDLYGDPLPPGAVARLGTVRLRHAGLSDFVCLPDGKTVLTAGNDRVVRFWDLETGKQVRQVRLQGRGDSVHHVRLSPDGKTLVTGDDRQLVIHEVETGKELAAHPTPKTGVSYLCFSPDGKTLALGRNNPYVTFLTWSAGAVKEVSLSHWCEYSSHGNFSPDGKWFVASAVSQGELWVYELAGDKISVAHRLPGDFTVASECSHDSKTLAVMCVISGKEGRESAICLFDVKTGQQRKEISLGDVATYHRIAFSPDGKKLSCSQASNVRIVDCESGRTLHLLRDSPSMTAFTRDGKRLLGIVGNRLLCWDLATGKELHNRPGDIGWSRVVALSPDGRRIATSDPRSNAIVSVWDSASGRRIRDLPADETSFYTSHLAFSADGRTVTAYEVFGWLLTWDVASGKALGQVALHGTSGEAVQTLSLSADGMTASTVAHLQEHDKTLKRARLWRLPEGTAMAEYALPFDASSYAWLRGGKALAYTHPAGVVLADLATGGERLRVAAPTLGALTSSPDERLLASLQPGGKVAVWETATGKPVTTVGAGVQVVGLALLPGNRLLLTMDRRRLHVWDLATGKERQGWVLPDGATADDRRLLAFPCGRRASTVLNDGTALVWGLTPAVVARVVPPPGAEELEAKWADLAADDARKAYASVWRFGEASEREAVAFLRRRLRPAAVADSEAINKHIEDLDSVEFPVRAKAEQTLEAMGHAATPAMWTAFAKGPSLEVRRRLEKLLAKAALLPATPKLLRGLRALQVLEGFASKDARGLLEELAKDEPHAALRVAAAEALARLKRSSR